MAAANTPEDVAANAAPAVPNVWVRVRDDNTAVHGGEHHGPGDEFEVEGPTAFALFAGGHVLPIDGPTGKAKK